MSQEPVALKLGQFRQAPDGKVWEIVRWGWGLKARPRTGRVLLCLKEGFVVSHMLRERAEIESWPLVVPGV